MNNEQKLTLMSNDNKEINISLPAAQLSGTVRNLLTVSTTDECKNRIIIFRFMRSGILKNIVDILELKHRVDKNGILVSDNTIAATILNHKKIKHIKNCLMVADFLDIPFLINAAAKKIISLTCDEGYAVNDKKFSPRITLYLKKHRVLWQQGVRQELSVEEYIKSIFLKKTKHGIVGALSKRHYCNHYVRNHLCLRKKGLTSLRGIKQLADNSVTILYLSDNHILDRSLDPQCPRFPFFNFTNLRELYFDDNNLHVLNADMLCGLYNLNKLVLDFNKIDTLDEQAFRDLTQLKKLCMFKNNIQSLPTTLFNNVRNLTQLDLGFNNITQLPEKIFNSLSHVVRLYIQHNKLKALHDNLFVPLKKLKRLSLYGNELNELSDTIVNSLHGLDQLDVSKNRLDQKSKERLIMLNHQHRVKVTL